MGKIKDSQISDYKSKIVRSKKISAHIDAAINSRIFIAELASGSLDDVSEVEMRDRLYELGYTVEQVKIALSMLYTYENNYGTIKEETIEKILNVI